MLLYQDRVRDSREKQGEPDQRVDRAENDRGVQSGVGAGEAASGRDHGELYGGGHFEVLVAVDITSQNREQFVKFGAVA